MIADGPVAHCLALDICVRMIELNWPALAWRPASLVQPFEINSWLGVSPGKCTSIFEIKSCLVLPGQLSSLNSCESIVALVCRPASLVQSFEISSCLGLSPGKPTSIDYVEGTTSKWGHRRWGRTSTAARVWCSTPCWMPHPFGRSKASWRTN